MRCNRQLEFLWPQRSNKVYLTMSFLEAKEISSNVRNKVSSLSLQLDQWGALQLEVYLSEQYVNNPTLSDVKFLVEGGNLSKLLEYFQLAYPNNTLITILSFL